MGHDFYNKMKNPTGTREWASSTLNFVKGCEGDCIYCYARHNALRFKRIQSSDEWEVMTVNWEKVNKGYRKKGGTIMIPSSHDICPSIIEPTIIVLRKLLEAGNNLLIVSKPHLSCIKRICEEFNDYRDNILFRFTIGTIYDAVAKFWEPGAPSIIERISCLELAYNLRFKTSVSCEPLLIGRDVFDLVDMVEPFVTDSIWLGGMNQINRRVDLSKIPEDKMYIIEGARKAASLNAVKKYYEGLKDNPKIKWKDSFKKLLGLDAPNKIGLDI